MEIITFEDKVAINENQNIPAINKVKASDVNELKYGINNLWNYIYPVGSIYLSTNSTNPSTLFGGTWTQIKDTFLLSAGDVYSAGETGGEATHTLTVEEMPSHNHVISGAGNTNYATGASTNMANKNGSNPNTTSTNNTGGGQAHNNMPPYLAVYMWQRTE